MNSPDSFPLIPCIPPAWARGSHCQTILGAFMPFKPLAEKGEIHWINLPDGDQLHLELYLPSENTSKRPSTWTIYLFHGLSGDISADYMQCTARVALKQGHRVVLVNHRGCGAGIAKAKLPYHSGRGEDASEVIRWGRKKNPGFSHLAVGFSLGGNVVLNMVSGNRGNECPEAAISVNAPIDLKACSEALVRGFNRLYDIRFVKRLGNEIKERARLNLIAPVKIPRLATLAQFDDLYTAPRGGFTDRFDYYEKCSTYLHLEKIKVPTFLLTAADDPFVPVAAYRNAKLAPHVRLHIEKTGGHLGYLTQPSSEVPTRRWLDYALHRMLEKITEPLTR